MTYSKKTLIYFKTNGSQKKILCALVSYSESRNHKMTAISNGYCEKEDT